MARLRGCARQRPRDRGTERWGNGRVRATDQNGKWDQDQRRETEQWGHRDPQEREGREAKAERGFFKPSAREAQRDEVRDTQRHKEGQRALTSWGG